MYHEIEINMITDEPEQDNPLFDFNRQAKLIADFIIDDKLKTPFVIAIDGEWGSGKTTFLKAVKRAIKKSTTVDEIGIDDKCENMVKAFFRRFGRGLKRYLIKYLARFIRKIIRRPEEEKLKILEFSSWEYEKTDVFAALLKKLSDGYEVRKLSQTALKIVTDLGLRYALGMTLNDIRDHFKGTNKITESLRCDLEKAVKTKTILFIDDLDRCDIFNILRMLESIKWFLTIENMVVIIAVDMSKIESVWDMRYNSSTAKMVGRDHAEKMFQIKFPVPVKTNADLVTYVSRMDVIKGDDAKFFVDSMPQNPRKLKLGINLLQLELNNIPELNLEQSINMEIYRKTLITWIAISSHHRDIARISRMSPDILMEASIVCSEAFSRSWLRAQLDSYVKSKKVINISNLLQIDYGYVRPELLEILEICTSDDRPAFRTLSEYGKTFDLRKKITDGQFNLDMAMKKLDEFKYTLVKIITHTSL